MRLIDEQSRQDGLPYSGSAEMRNAIVTVVVVARYAAVRAGLRAMMHSAGGIEVRGEAGSAADLDEILPRFTPDVVVIDLEVQELRPALATLRAREAAAVVFADPTDAPVYDDMRGLPGWGVLPRDAEAVQIVAAVRAASTGLAVLDAAAATAAELATAAGPVVNADDEPLSSRERQVLQLMAQGLPNKGIAARLDISPHTVKFHVTSIMAKLGAASRTEAVTIGARRGDVRL